MYIRLKLYNLFLLYVERLRRPVNFQSEGVPVVTAGGPVAADAERVLGAVSLAFAALAALAVAALVLVLLARRR